MRLSKAAVLLAATSLFAMTDAAFAQSAGGSNAAIADPDIIVTARRVEERLQDVPISITVFSQQQLANRNVTNGSELATYTPSLQVDDRFGTNNTIFSIRGFQQDLRTSATVGVYFADVVAQRGGNGGSQAGDGAGPGAFFDLQNLQVLKGPQGTLFGRNTTGGAILLVPRKPTGEFEGYVEGTYGNYDQRRIEAVLNVPLSENARLRVGVDRNKRDGYLRNISGIGPDRIGNIDYIAARASLVVDLTPNLENYTIVSFAHSNDTGPIAKVTHCGDEFPNNASFRSRFAAINQLCRQQIDRQAGHGFYTVQNIQPNPKSELRTWQVINTTTWQVSDSLRIKNIVSYGQLYSFVRASLMGADYVIPNSLPNAAGVPTNTSAIAGTHLSVSNLFTVDGGTADQSNFVEEFQLQGTVGDKLNWQAGAYYESSQPLNMAVGGGAGNFLDCPGGVATNCRDVLTAALGIPLGNLSLTTTFARFRNVGVYAQGTYELLDGLKLTGGIRYTWDKSSGGGTGTIRRFNSAGQVTSTACTIASPDPVANAALRANGCVSSGSISSKAPTWVLGLDYKVTPDILLYAKYSRGYRQGIFTANAPLGFQEIGPEKIDSYEGGIKASFDGFVRGTFNVSGFYNDISDQQLLTAFASSVGAVGTTVVALNVGKSRLYGVEVDGSISPVDWFRIDGSYAYLNSRIQEVATVPAPYGPYDIIRTLSVVGARFPKTPRHKLSVTGTITLPVPEEYGRLSVSGTYSYSAEYDYFANPFGALRPTNLVNASINWNSVAGSDFDVTAFATNLTQKKYYTALNDSLQSSGFLSYMLGTPRFYGLRVRYNFGQ